MTTECETKPEKTYEQLREERVEMLLCALDTGAHSLLLDALDTSRLMRDCLCRSHEALVQGLPSLVQWQMGITRAPQPNGGQDDLSKEIDRLGESMAKYFATVQRGTEELTQRLDKLETTAERHGRTMVKMQNQMMDDQQAVEDLKQEVQGVRK